MPRQTAANRPVRQRTTVQIYSDDNPNTFTVKRKRGEEAPTPPPPVKKRPSLASQQPVVPSPPSPTAAAPEIKKRRKVQERPRPKACDTIVSHTAMIQPAVPLRLLMGGSRPPKPQTATYQRLGKSPTWEPLKNIHQPQASIPHSMITWLEPRSDVEGYAVTGDTRGIIQLLHLSRKGLKGCLKTLSTSASIREMQRTITSKKVISYPNAIVQCSWHGRFVTVLTNSELEILDIDNSTILCTYNISSDSDMKCHASLGSCLAMNAHCSLFCSWNRSLDDWETTNEGDSSNSSLIQFAVTQEDDKCVVRSPVQVTLSDPSALFCCWTARFEKFGKADDLLLCVAQTDHGIEFLRGRLQVPVSDESAAANTLEIVNRASLPYASSKTTASDDDDPYAVLPVQDVSIEIVDKEFVLVAGRDIRLFDSQELHCIGVFGENVQLHGKSLRWNRCCYITPPPDFFNILQVEHNKKKPKYWVQYDDLLAARETQCSDDSADTERWMIGIPHPYKGPEELRDNIYVWKPATHESFTMNGPAAKGMLNFYMQNNTLDMIALGAKDGVLYDLSSKLKTNFAGTMYPVGYQVIDENLEYIEDEDELDQIEMVDPESPKKLDADIAEAMRLSLLEQEKTKVQKRDEPEEKISVLAEPEDAYMVPCRPEVFDSDDPSSPTSSPVKRPDLDHPFEDAFLFGMPQSRLVRKTLENDLPDPFDSSDGDRKLKPKPKRGRTANVEMILQNAIDSELRREVGNTRTVAASGTGSTLNTSELRKKSLVQTASPEEKALAMELLLLSPASHAKEIKRLEEEEKANMPTLPDIETDEKETVVTPSEQSPTLGDKGDASAESKEGSVVKECRTVSEDLQCAACCGRMVVHTCGKREMPIDYEALAREEELRKEHEEAERQRIRMERRRVAEAKRRETKRRKKLEEEKRLEEQLRAQQLEAERRSQSTQWQQQTSYHSQYGAPSFAAQVTDYQQSSLTYSEPLAQRAAVSPHPSTSSWNEGSLHSSINETVNIDGNEVDKSASLQPLNALEALAGLAGKLASPVPVGNSKDTAEKTSWNGSYDDNEDKKPPPFAYSPSSQRRANVAHAFAAILNEESRRLSGSNVDMQTYSVAEDGTLKVQQEEEILTGEATANSTTTAKHAFGTASPIAEPYQQPVHAFCRDPPRTETEADLKQTGMSSQPSADQDISTKSEITFKSSPYDSRDRQSPSQARAQSRDSHSPALALSDEAPDAPVHSKPETNGNDRVLEADGGTTGQETEPCSTENAIIEQSSEKDALEADTTRGSLELAEQLLQFANSAAENAKTAQPLQS